MTSNMANGERALRIAGGLALISEVLIGAIGPWGWIGAVPIVTGLLGTCPLYRVLGLTTCPVKRA